MEDVHEEFLVIVSQGSVEVDDVIQSQYMSEEAREIFLENFEEDREHSLMGFCVMGGIFSEGIDLTGEQLIGAVIVGTGLPQVCRERELLKPVSYTHLDVYKRQVTVIWEKIYWWKVI